MMEAISRMIRNLLASAVLRGLEEGHGLRRVTVSILDDEVKGDIEHAEPYGFSSRAQLGAEALVVFPGAARDHGVVLVVSDRRHRPKDLEAGEVVFFDDQGQEIRLTRGGIHVKTTQEDGVTIETTKATVIATGDVSVSSETRAVVTAPELHLGGEGGKRVARVGDATSDGATITEGSAKVFAVD